MALVRRSEGGHIAQAVSSRDSGDKKGAIGEYHAAGISIRPVALLSDLCIHANHPSGSCRKAGPPRTQGSALDSETVQRLGFALVDESGPEMMHDAKGLLKVSVR